MIDSSPFEIIVHTAAAAGVTVVDYYLLVNLTTAHVVFRTVC